MTTNYKHFISYVPPQVLRQFKHFLISHHIYSQYRHNFMSQETIRWRFKHKIQHCLSNVDLINDAFSCPTTPTRP